MVQGMKFDFEKPLKKVELVEALKNEVQDISVMDIMEAHSYLVNEGRYIQESYRDEYLKAYVKAFLTRLRDLRNENFPYHSDVDVDELKDALDNLEHQEKNLVEGEFNPCFWRIYSVMSIYTSFVLEEPIHIVGTPFPGGFKVKKVGDDYLCPVKEKQKDNPGAVCGFCIAEQDEDV